MTCTSILQPDTLFNSTHAFRAHCCTTPSMYYTRSTVIHCYTTPSMLLQRTPSKQLPCACSHRHPLLVHHLCFHKTSCSPTSPCRLSPDTPSYCATHAFQETDFRLTLLLRHTYYPKYRLSSHPPIAPQMLSEIYTFVANSYCATHFFRDADFRRKLLLRHIFSEMQTFATPCTD